MTGNSARCTPRYDVTAFGETMLRLSACDGRSLRTAQKLDVHLGGAESNVLAALSQLGRTCAWFSRIPQTALGDRIAGELSSYGVNTSHVSRAEDGRAGLYFVEHGLPPATTSVIYDRRASALAMNPSDGLDEGAILDSRVVHLTGITPALSGDCADLILRLVKRARSAGVLVSFDVNYRSRLWTTTQAYETLGPIIEQVNVLICSIDDSSRVFRIDEDGPGSALALRRRFNVETVVVTQGEKGATAVDDAGVITVPAIPTSTVDPFGAGDAFCAGVVDGILDGSLEAGLRRGVVLASIKMTQTGDIATITRQGLERVLAGIQTGGIFR